MALHCLTIELMKYHLSLNHCACMIGSLLDSKTVGSQGKLAFSNVLLMYSNASIIKSFFYMACYALIELRLISHISLQHVIDFTCLTTLVLMDIQQYVLDC